MKFVVSSDETLSTGKVAAGAVITVTAANADELFALSQMHRGYLVDDIPVAAAPGNVGPAYATFVAKQGDITLSSASPVPGAATGALFARIRSNLPGAFSLIDDAGARVTLSGRSLLYTATPFVVSTPINITVAVGSVQKTFTLYPSDGAVLGPLTGSFTIGSTATFLTVTGLAPGEYLRGSPIPNDGRIAINASRTGLAPGLSVSSPGTITYTIRTSLGRTLTVAVTAGTGSITANAVYGMPLVVNVPGLGSGETISSATGSSNISGANVTYAGPKTDFSSVITTSTGRTIPLAVTTPLPTPFLIDALDSLTGVTNIYSNGGAISLDTVDKKQGAASLVMTPTGVPGSGAAFRHLTAFTADPANLGTISMRIRYPDKFPDTGPNAASITLTNNGVNAQGPTGQVGLWQSGTTGVTGPGWKWQAVGYNEMANTGNFVTGLFDYRVDVAPLAPYAEPIKVDAIVGNSGGKPTLILTCDDGYEGQYLRLYPKLASLNMRATLYNPSVSGVSPGRAGFLTIAMRQALKAAGWGMSLDGTMDDSIMTAQPSMAALIANLQSGRDWLTNNNLLDGKGGENHLCYPNGVTCDSGNGGVVDGSVPLATSIPVTSVTSDGSTTITLTAAPATPVTVGLTFINAKIPGGAKVVTVNSTTSFVLDTAVPAGSALYGRFLDLSGTFAFGKMQTALAAAGYKSGRTTVAANSPFYSRYGVEDQGLFLPATGTTGVNGQTAQQNANALLLPLNAAVNRGGTMMVYIHDYVVGNSASINLGSDVGDIFFGQAAAFRDAGQLEILTVAEWWNRDGANPAALPF